MTEHDQNEHHLPGHTGGVSWTPKKIILTIVLGFVVPILLIVLLSQLLLSTSKETGPANSPAAVEARIAPVGQLTVVNPNAPKVEKTGDQVVTETCSACHGTGAMGAPKIGDAAAWAPRIKQGYQTLIQHAMNGYKNMPAKGGNPDLDELEIARAIAVMANKSGAHFTPPAAAPATAPAASAENSAAAAPAASAGNSAAAAPATAPVAAAPAAPAAASAAATAASGNGKATFDSTCSACHGTGVMGAPKFGDKAAWAPRIAKGKDTLYQHALHGFNNMPPKGGNPSLSDADVKAAVDYMINAAK